jgi:ATP-dependent DNA ligase
MTMPEWMVPMAATLTQERFTGPEWLFEQKLDGIRLLAFRRGDGVTLYSRNRLAREVPAVAGAIAALPVREAILDGELEWHEGAYHVFDVLWLDGRDLCALPLEARRELLRGLPLEAGWEGVIAKRRGTPYEHRRSKHWLKMKVEVAQPFVVGGFTDPQGARVGLGALLVGTRDGDDLAFAGKVGTGLDTAGLLALRARLDALEVAASPFTRGTGLPRARVHWVRPEVIVDVGFIEWTVHGKLRHPRLLGVRA